MKNNGNSRTSNILSEKKVVGSIKHEVNVVPRPYKGSNIIAEKGKQKQK